MSQQLSSKHQHLVARIIERGRYQDTDDVHDAALRHLDERERDLTELRAAIAEGDAATAHGDVVDWTPDFFTHLDQDEDEAELVQRQQTADHATLGNRPR